IRTEPAERVAGRDRIGSGRVRPLHATERPRIVRLGDVDRRARLIRRDGGDHPSAGDGVASAALQPAPIGAEWQLHDRARNDPVGNVEEASRIFRTEGAEIERLSLSRRRVIAPLTELVVVEEAPRVTEAAAQSAAQTPGELEDRGIVPAPRAP